MSEKDEIKIAQCITENCQRISGTETELGGGLVVGDLWKMIADIDNVYRGRGGICNIEKE